MEVDFTKQDLDVLSEAVEKWEQDDTSGEIMGIMLEGLMGDKSPEAQQKMKAEREERAKKRKVAQKIRKERGVLLRAKLLKLKDLADAERLAESL